MYVSTHTHTDFFLFSCYTHFDHMGLLRTIKQRLCSIYIVKYPIRKLIYFSFRHWSVKYLASYFRRMWSVQTILTFLNSRRAYMFRYIDKYLFSLSSSSFLVDSNETTDLGRRSGCLEELYTVAKSRSWIRNMKWCKTSPKITKICFFCVQFPSRLSMLWAFFSSFFSSLCGDRNSWEADFMA